MDFVGIMLLSVGLAAMQYILEEGARNDWFDSRAISICAVVATLGLILFVMRELTAPVPVVDLTLFKDSVFLSGTLIGAVMFAMLLSITFLLPVFMQELLGFTAMQSGLALMPRSLVMILVMPIVGRIYNKVSPRVVVAFGIVVFAFTAYVMSHYTLDTSARGIIDVLALQGVAFSCLFIPLTTVALSSIPRHKLADAAGLNTLFRQIGGSMGLAIFASLINRYSTEARFAISAHLYPGRPELIDRLRAITGGLMQHGFDMESARDAAYRMLGGEIAQQSMVITFERLFLLSGIAFLCVLPLLLFLKSPAHGAPKPEVHVEM
jgi:DHA2 family multidrug resistance protein